MTIRRTGAIFLSLPSAKAALLSVVHSGCRTIFGLPSRKRRESSQVMSEPQNTQAALCRDGSLAVSVCDSKQPDKPGVRTLVRLQQCGNAAERDDREVRPRSF